MIYRKGDELTLRIEEDFGYEDLSVRKVNVIVIGNDTSYDEMNTGYLCYVPHYEHLKDSFKLTKKHQNYYEFDKKFLGEEAVIIDARTEIFEHIKAQEGEQCNNCNEFFEGTQKTNNVFLCRQCTQNPYR